MNRNQLGTQGLQRQSKARAIRLRVYFSRTEKYLVSGAIFYL